MAKEKSQSEAKTFTIDEFLGTISLSERDSWVVKKIYAKNNDAKSADEWTKELNKTCKGITIKN